VILDLLTRKAVSLRMRDHGRRSVGERGRTRGVLLPPQADVEFASGAGGCADQFTALDTLDDIQRV
jgi:hypothetical protein